MQVICNQNKKDMQVICLILNINWIWLRSMSKHIEETCSLSSKRRNTTINYEHNTMSIA